MTDNRNRTAPEIRKVFEVHGGKLGATNCVAWMFERKGLIVVDGDSTDEESLVEAAIDSGGEDVRHAEGTFEVTCEVEAYSEVCAALDEAGIEIVSKQVTRIPSNTVELDAGSARGVLKLLETLDDHDDVQNVAANFNLPQEVLAELSKA
jgi:YebC/PmpR family DNA-binding regulatory protein